MFIKLIFSLLLLPLAFGFSSSPAASDDCTCPAVSNLQLTGQTSTTCSFTWNAPDGATQVRVWYVRQEDAYTSPYAYTSGTGYQFTNLTPGHYTFKFQTICGSQESGFIVTEDITQM